MSTRDDRADPLEILRRVEDTSPPAGAQERVLASLSVSAFSAAIGGGGPLGGGATAVAGRSLRQLARRFATWSLLPLAAGIVIGANGRALLGSERARGASAPATATAAPHALPAAAVVLPTFGPLPSPTVGGAASGVVDPLSPSDKLVSSPKPISDDSLASERAVLDRARQKLAVSEPEHALQFLEQHAGRYPNGKLAEEREAMLINVLVSLGRAEQAKARGAAFTKRFPASLMLLSVKAALAANQPE